MKRGRGWEKIVLHITDLSKPRDPAALPDVATELVVSCAFKTPVVFSQRDLDVVSLGDAVTTQSSKLRDGQDGTGFASPRWSTASMTA